MSALMIKDLSVNEALGTKAMKAVRGGYMFAPFGGFKLDIDNSKKVNAQQLIQQGLTINNVSDNNNAFASGLHTTIKPTMEAHNNVTVY